eukprot:Opistho-2@89815
MATSRAKVAEAIYGVLDRLARQDGTDPDALVEINSMDDHELYGPGILLDAIVKCDNHSQTDFREPEGTQHRLKHVGDAVLHKWEDMRRDGIAAFSAIHGWTQTTLHLLKAALASATVDDADSPLSLKNFMGVIADTLSAASSNCTNAFDNLGMIREIMNAFKDFRVAPPRTLIVDLMSALADARFSQGDDYKEEQRKALHDVKAAFGLYADVDARADAANCPHTGEGYAPLHYAARIREDAGGKDLTELLLAYKADPLKRTVNACPDSAAQSLCWSPKVFQADNESPGVDKFVTSIGAPCNCKKK